MIKIEKATKILKDGKAKGKDLTKKQVGFFGAIAGGAGKKLAQLKELKDAKLK